MFSLDVHVLYATRSCGQRWLQPSETISKLVEEGTAIVLAGAVPYMSLIGHTLVAEILAKSPGDQL